MGGTSVSIYQELVKAAPSDPSVLTGTRETRVRIWGRVSQNDRNAPANIGVNRYRRPDNALVDESMISDRDRVAKIHSTTRALHDLNASRDFKF